MTKEHLTRRAFLLGSGAALGGLAAACATQAPVPPETIPSSPSTNGRPVTLPAPSELPSPSPSPRQPVLRLAHLTDMHVAPDDVARRGFARALRHAQARTPSVDAVLNTGDSIMEALFADRAAAQAQWDAFRSVLDAELTLPIYHCIGNHDVWGWGLDDPSLPSDALYGKGFALQALGLSSPYYTFDLGAWRFIVLDSTHPRILPPDAPHADIPYTGRLDDAQFHWLEDQIAATPPEQPVCIVSHIPIFSACELIDGPNEETGNWLIPGAWIHIDARRMWELFRAHPNVRACLSGHTHQHERIDYHGVTYLSDGAVCGSWWQGDYLGFPPGYVVVSFYVDGTLESEFIEYDEP
jgi:3',5'-cyclic AMP phosphodiesterase CpdA